MEGEGGWTRVAYVNMTQAGATCLQGLEQISFNGSPYCGRFSPESGCVSAIHNATISYRQVCGQVAGYQYNSVGAFLYPSHTIDEAFFDGLSIMYDSPRRHIWTYTAGFADNKKGAGGSCPCNNGSIGSVPPYVGSDYYCESAHNTSSIICYNHYIQFSHDVLWDGQQCGGLESPCCTHPNMPWFMKTLNETTTEDIELRACKQPYGCSNDGVAIFLIEIYVR